MGRTSLDVTEIRRYMRYTRLMMGLTDIRDSFDLDGEVTETPMSRTHQYRKVMKPMLERRRRARINKCLDELKDLMVVALQTVGESITKLEKADVLELTVRHLKKLRRQQMLTINPHLEQDKYRTGFTACATEVSRGQHQVKADEPSWPKTCHGLCCGASFTSSSIRFNDKSSSGHLSRPCQGVSAIFSPGLRSRVQQWQRFHPLTFTPGKFKVCRCQCGKSKRP